MFCRHHLYTKSADFAVSSAPRSGWFHSVFTFLGSGGGGPGVEVYLDGRLEGADTTGSAGGFTDGGGTVVVGRVYTDDDKWYGSFTLDELLFFNRVLSAAEAQLIYAMYD